MHYSTRNAQLKFREEITCFGSHSHPDFAARIKNGIILDERLHYDLYPAVFLAEAKKEPLPETQTIQSAGHLQVPSGSEKSLGIQYPLPRNAKTFPMVAQMAFAAYPSLVIIIAFLIRLWRSESKVKPSREVLAQFFVINQLGILKSDYRTIRSLNGLLFIV